MAHRNHPQKVEDAAKCLSKFACNSKIALEQLHETKKLFEDEILNFLQLYCSDYIKLGISDDKFYKTLHLRTMKIDNRLQRFEKLISCVDENLPIQSEYFSDCFFSQELAIEFDCDTFPIVRLISDLIQKLEVSCDTAADWLRSDRVYMEEVEREIENRRSKVHDIEHQLQQHQLVYDSTFASLKLKKINKDDNEVELLSKSIRVTGREKARLAEELDWANSQLTKIVIAMRNRMYPNLNSDKKIKNSTKKEGKHLKRNDSTGKY